jgi:hypothetical protein
MHFINMPTFCLWFVHSNAHQPVQQQGAKLHNAHGLSSCML